VQIHHVCLIVRDIDISLKLYRDVLGFRAFVDTIIPDDRYFNQRTLDDIVKVRGAKARMVLCASPEGALLEFQQPIVPGIQQTPDKYLRYGHTGISKLVFKVSDVDAWFDRIQVAGFEMQTDYVWEAAGVVRSFIFYDVDGHMVQICEDLVEDLTVGPRDERASKGDERSGTRREGRADRRS